MARPVHGLFTQVVLNRKVFQVSRRFCQDLKDEAWQDEAEVCMWPVRKMPLSVSGTLSVCP